ncbi:MULTISPECIES: hypothetical protein [unclassified Caulobacter]|jgi:hypothetical protein|uniref:hypothetical protein n=1 Tax=unclassified Caulobacter TaxID=2648921 RepID=UPI000B0B534C|nr:MULTISPECIES: hypothetical protein [unclassified Caulobacter]
MTPYELRRANIAHFTLLLARTNDPSERSRIEGLRDEERLKPDEKYPQTGADSKRPRD